MSKQSLAVKYRPTNFDDLIEQTYIKEILKNQIKEDNIKNVYLFTGPAGCGKTTSARIFANMINDGQYNSIEIDAASNNGVEQIRTIIDDAKFKPINSKYKVYILDECHMLSIGAWNAMLKLLEEPPKSTIFILCTTDPQKIPKTILSRVQRFDFNKISLEGITNKLINIATLENIKIENKALQFIAKLSDGGMRDAISMLDKCISYNIDLSLDKVINILGVNNYDIFYLLLMNILENKIKSNLDIIKDNYEQGKDLKLFIKQFISFIIDIEKYLIYNSFDYIQIPETLDLTLFKEKDYNIILYVLKEMINLSNEIKYESNPRILIEGKLLLLRSELNNAT